MQVSPVVHQPGHAPQQAVIITQPHAGHTTSSQWGGGAAPPSLQLLAEVPQLMIKREISWMKVCSGWETNAEYQITDAAGNLLFRAKEESDLGSRYRLLGTRGFKFRIFDNSNAEVMRVNRHFKACQGMCCALTDYCENEVSVLSPIDEVAGYVHQTNSCCVPKYKIFDSHDKEMMKVKGPCCVAFGICGICCNKQKFDVDSDTISMPNGGGMISKVWSGIIKELLTDSVDFQIDFPPGLDVKGRASMMGAAILVDFNLWYNRRAWGFAFASWVSF